MRVLAIDGAEKNVECLRKTFEGKDNIIVEHQILLDDIKDKSLEHLTELADKIIKKIEANKNLEDSLDEYQKLIKLNNIIEKKFQKKSKEILSFIK